MLELTFILLDSQVEQSVRIPVQIPGLSQQPPPDTEQSPSGPSQELLDWVPLRVVLWIHGNSSAKSFYRYVDVPTLVL